MAAAGTLKEGKIPFDQLTPEEQEEAEYEGEETAYEDTGDEEEEEAEVEAEKKKTFAVFEINNANPPPGEPSTVATSDKDGCFRVAFKCGAYNRTKPRQFDTCLVLSDSRFDTLLSIAVTLTFRTVPNGKTDARGR